MIKNLAADRPILGAGFNPWYPETYILYGEGAMDDDDMGLAAHSIYLSPLAEHGYVGLAMFVSILAVAYRTGSQVIRRCRARSDLLWLQDLMKAVQVGMVAYCVGGMFHQLAYFDLPWQMMSITAIGWVISGRERTPEAALKA